MIIENREMFRINKKILNTLSAGMLDTSRFYLDNEFY